MAVSPHISPSLSRYKFFSTSVVENPNFSPYRIYNRRRVVTQSHLQAHNSTTSYGRTELASSSKKLWIRQRSFSETEVEQGQLEDEEEIDIGDEASLLSLSMKPDRNMALLDDYEMEELGHTPHTNHRSGLFPS